jgi:flagellin-like hook-associated protein FlgL
MSQTPEEIQADIERQREQLAETVDQLGHKLDVKAQTKAKVDDVKVQAKEKVEDVRVQAKEAVVEVKERATTDDGKPRPEVLGAAAAVVLGLAVVIWLRRRR